jgi:hypothetical protein
MPFDKPRDVIVKAQRWGHYQIRYLLKATTIKFK